MSSDFNFNSNKKSRGIGIKGLYIALSLCLLGAVGATWYSIDKSVKNIDDPSSPFVSGADADKSGNTSEEPPSQEPSTEPPKQPTSSSDSTDSDETGTSSDSYQASVDLSPEFFAMPVNGDVINHYSDGLVVKNETLSDWRTHDGVDIAASVTTPVKAIADGKVKEIYNDPLYGTVVVVSHGGDLESYYSNLNEVVNVEVGQSVTIGHVLGSVGSSAIAESASPEHLHFAMKEKGEWIDPLEKIGVDK